MTLSFGGIHTGFSVRPSVVHVNWVRHIAISYIQTATVYFKLGLSLYDRKICSKVLVGLMKLSIVQALRYFLKMGQFRYKFLPVDRNCDGFQSRFDFICRINWFIAIIILFCYIFFIDLAEHV